MLLPTPHLDRARELLSAIEETALLPSSVLDASDDGVRLQVAAAMVASNLAIAEAVHVLAAASTEKVA